MVDVHIDDEFKKIFFQLSERRFAQLNLIKEKCLEIESFWDAKKAKIPPTRARRAVYDRLVAKGAEGEYVSSEYGLVVDCLFFGAGVDRPPIFEEERLCAFVGNLVEEHAENRALVRSWCRSVLQVWPAGKPELLDGLIRRTLRIVGSGGPAEDPVVVKFMDLDAPAWIGQSVPMGGLLDDFVADESGNLATRFSGFATEAWRRGLSRYTRLIAASEGDWTATSDVLSQIERESVLPSRRFRDLNKADAFARAVLEHYTVGTGRLPALEIQDLFWRFFERIFGETDDPESQYVWSQISEELKKLIRHWKQGRALIASFDLVGLLAARYGGGDASANIHWGERVSFWRKVWNSGLVTSCKVFVSKSRLSCPEVYEYANKGVLIGNAGSEDAGKSVIVMTLKRSVLVAETSYQGALRIVDLRAHSRADITGNSCLSHSWRSSLSVIGIQVNHTPGWQRRALRVLNEVLGFNVL